MTKSKRLENVERLLASHQRSLEYVCVKPSDLNKTWGDCLEEIAKVRAEIQAMKEYLGVEYYPPVMGKGEMKEIQERKKP